MSTLTALLVHVLLLRLSEAASINYFERRALLADVTPRSASQ
jgi:hypothetical protein